VSAPVLLDTGPLVAFLSRRDKYHRWSVNQFSRTSGPVLTCEPVLTEACFLMAKLTNGSESVLKLVETGLIRIGFDLEPELTAIRKLVVRYVNVPMSLADACLVRMSEQYSGGTVLTIDSDFKIYRKHGRQVIPVIMP
jgi:uncharacterized protein